MLGASGIAVVYGVAFIIGCVMIRIGIDYSRNTQQSKEILQELREIKEILMDAGVRNRD